MTKLGRIEARRREIAGEIVERRRVQRAWVELPARLRLPQVDAAFPCSVLNLSLSGAYVRTPALVPEGTLVELELRPPGSLLPLQARGRIMRHAKNDDASGVGVAFEWVSFEATGFIEQVLARLP